jgi:HPt (histidine-containing phosphotransfer) domain-containing protein
MTGEPVPDPSLSPSREEALNSAQEILSTYARAYRIELPKIFSQMHRCAQGLAEPGASDPALANASLSLLRRDAHDMKGQGTMFGLPALSLAASDFASLLARYDAEAPDLADILYYIETLEQLVGDAGMSLDGEAMEIIEAARQRTGLDVPTSDQT